MNRKKTAILIAFLFACFVFILSACQEDDATTTVVDNSEASFTANVDDKDWKADSVWAHLVTDTVNNLKTLTITGYGSDKELTVIITDSSQAAVDSAVAIQTYVYKTSEWGTAAGFLYASTPVSIGSSDTVWSKYGVGYDGATVVTADDAANKKVSGNFHFDAQTFLLDSAGVNKDTVKITNGIFKNVRYKYSH